jgi:diguanylate cyclase (GGDEF)-like protein
VIIQFCLLSLVNIGAGFGLATALGRRYRKMTARELWASLTVDLPSVAPTPKPAAPATVAVNTVPAPPPADAAPGPKGPGLLAIDDLQGQVADFGAKLLEADERLRQCAASPDLGAIETVLHDIENTARNFAESRDSAQQRVADLTRGDGTWEGINNELAVAAQMQDAEIKAACQEIANFNYENDLAGGCQKIVGCTHRLLNCNDMLSDAVHKAMAEVVQQESHVPEDADRSDPLTGCVNRAGIEHDLGAWWAGVTDHERLCVAMIDIDRLSETNEQFGHRVGNEIIKAVARLLEANRSDTVQVARFSGQRFLLMFSDTDPRAAVNTIERCRQTIGNARFDHKDADIRITVSCSLARASNDDSPSSMLLRAEAALREAKRYGHNRTFMHEGKYPTPVVPPELTIEPLRIPL